MAQFEWYREQNVYSARLKEFFEAGFLDDFHREA